MSDVTAAIESACNAAGLSQYALAERAGISQQTLSQLLSGKRAAKMPELILIADATGCTVAQFTGSKDADRLQCAVRSTNGATMESMRQRLQYFMELDVYLDDHAIPVS